MVLTTLALAAGAFRNFVRIPLRLPSHSLLQWLPFVILGQLLVRRTWAGCYQGFLIGVFCCFHPGRIVLSFGALSLFSEYLLAGSLVSWLTHRLRVDGTLGWRLWLMCSAMGLAVNLGRLSYRFAYFLPWPERIPRFYAPIPFALFYLSFGLAAGLLAAAAYTVVRSCTKKSSASS